MAAERESGASRDSRGDHSRTELSPRYTEQIAKKVIIDTDPGIDDAIALALAFRSPELDVQSITVVAGNTPLDACVRNACGLAALYESAPIVAVGCAKPLEREPVHAVEVHGADGLGGASAMLPNGLQPSDTHASRVILELAARHPGEITLVTLGPLTNVATAMMEDPSAFSCLKEIVIMGGAFRIPGNITPCAEFNFYADPHAARKVVHCAVPKRIVGLDVTTQVLLTEYSQHGVLGKALDHYMDFAAGRGLKGCYIHDALAVAAVIDPALISTQDLRVDIETTGHATLGMSVADLRRRPEGQPNASVALGVDAGAMLAMVCERTGVK